MKDVEAVDMPEADVALRMRPLLATYHRQTDHRMHHGNMEVFETYWRERFEGLIGRTSSVFARYRCKIITSSQSSRDTLIGSSSSDLSCQFGYALTVR